jgi:hypothetical protein
MPHLFRLRVLSRNPAHVEVNVYAGVDGQRALLGRLTMAPHEWEHLAEIMRPHADIEE